MRRTRPIAAALSLLCVVEDLGLPLAAIVTRPVPPAGWRAGLVVAGHADGLSYLPAADIPLYSCFDQRTP